jgi:hypothetical protein
VRVPNPVARAFWRPRLDLCFLSQEPVGDFLTDNFRQFRIRDVLSDDLVATVITGRQVAAITALPGFDQMHGLNLLAHVVPRRPFLSRDPRKLFISVFRGVTDHPLHDQFLPGSLEGGVGDLSLLRDPFGFHRTESATDDRSVRLHGLIDIIAGSSVRLLSRRQFLVFVSLMPSLRVPVALRLLDQQRAFAIDCPVVHEDVGEAVDVGFVGAVAVAGGDAEVLSFICLYRSS